MVDVKQLANEVATIDRDLKSLIATLHERLQDDFTCFETLETSMDSVLKSIHPLDIGSHISSPSLSFQV